MNLIVKALFFLYYRYMWLFHFECGIIWGGKPQIKYCKIGIFINTSLIHSATASHAFIETAVWTPQSALHQPGCSACSLWNPVWPGKQYVRWPGKILYKLFAHHSRSMKHLVQLQGVVHLLAGLSRQYNLTPLLTPWLEQLVPVAVNKVVYWGELYMVLCWNTHIWIANCV